MLGKLGSALNSAISKILRGGPPDKEVILELKNAMLKALLEADVQFDLAAHVVNEVERKSLDKELAKDMEEYFPNFIEFDVWKETPQLRTVPVGQSIGHKLEVMPYEVAEELGISISE